MKRLNEFPNWSVLSETESMLSQANETIAKQNEIIAEQNEELCLNRHMLKDAKDKIETAGLNASQNDFKISQLTSMGDALERKLNAMGSSSMTRTDEYWRAQHLQEQLEKSISLIDRLMKVIEKSEAESSRLLEELAQTTAEKQKYSQEMQMLQSKLQNVISKLNEVTRSA